MGRKKKDNGGEPQGRSPAYTVFARVSPELGLALEAYIKSLKPKPSLTATVEALLEEGLQARGFWPPPEEGSKKK